MSALWRQIVLAQLEILSSEPQQLEYEQNVPHVDITRELLAGWFDDSYHPADAQFQSCFANGELEALATFDRTYEAKRLLLPPSNGSVKSWLASSVWREVMSAAAATLTMIEPNSTLHRTASPPAELGR